MPDQLDLLINARWVIPVDPPGAVLEHHAVAVRDGAIVAVLPQDEARACFRPDRMVDLADHALIPGLVNLHAHSAMALMRGIADDLPLMQWLQGAIWPTEARHVSPTFVRDGTLLAAFEMLRGGITTCNDMYFFPDAAAAAYDRSGMRAVLGLPVLEFATAYASSADDYMARGLAAREAWLGHPRIRFSMAPHAPYTVSDRSFERVVALAEELDLPIHIHVHETAAEIAESLTQHRARPLARLARLGVLGPSTIAVHAVHLDAADVDLLVRHACSVAHCPTSNMKLASGIAPIAALAARRLRIGLGTDGAASNNRLDLFQEMRHAALLAKVSSGDASILPAHEILRMATLDGASALGLATEIGSITSGKRADLCAVSFSATETQPCFDPMSHLVFVAGREHVSHVWIDGELRVDNGKAVLQTHNNDLPRITAMWHHKLVRE